MVNKLKKSNGWKRLLIAISLIYFIPAFLIVKGEMKEAREATYYLWKEQILDVANRSGFMTYECYISGKKTLCNRSKEYIEKAMVQEGKSEGWATYTDEYLVNYLVYTLDSFKELEFNSKYEKDLDFYSNIYVPMFLFVWIGPLALLYLFGRIFAWVRDGFSDVKS